MPKQNDTPVKCGTTTWTLPDVSGDGVTVTRASVRVGQGEPVPIKLAKAYQDMRHLRHRGHTPRWWVAQVQGEDGVDWGWTNDAAQAQLLTPYWQRRFMAYGRACGWKSFGLVDPNNVCRTFTQAMGPGDHTEWLKHMADAQRFGSADPAAVADVLTHGKVQDGAGE